MINFKNECVFSHDLNNLTIQIIFDAWWASVNEGSKPSATTLVSVRTTRVFRTALTALTEPRTLWRRIRPYPSPSRRVALHSISKMCFSHWSERMWSVNLDASISGVSDPRRAFLLAFRVTGRAGDKPGSAGDMSESTSNHSHVFSLYSHLCIYVSMYQYSYPSTRYIWTGCRRCLRAIWGALENDDRVNSEIYSEAVVERVWRCTWRR